MKLPSLLKIPSYKRFEYAPRYYDPIKEEINQRTELIKKQLGSKNLPDNEIDTAYDLRIKGSFGRRLQKDNSQNPAGLQFIVVILLSLTVYFYIQFGNIAIVILFFVFASYFYIKKMGLFNRDKD